LISFQSIVCNLISNQSLIFHILGTLDSHAGAPCISVGITVECTQYYIQQREYVEGQQYLHIMHYQSTQKGIFHKCFSKGTVAREFRHLVLFLHESTSSGSRIHTLNFRTGFLVHGDIQERLVITVPNNFIETFVFNFYPPPPSRVDQRPLNSNNSTYNNKKSKIR
jgi:hypothetical protein